MAGKAPIRVVISGAAGQIGYALIPLVASGRTFGDDQPLILHLLDITPAMGALKGVAMEIQDCAYPLVRDVVYTDNYDVAFKDVSWAILIGGFPRKKGMLRADLLKKNASIYIETGKALERNAAKDVRVLVVANPANTNALTLALNAKSIPAENITALTRLDMNRGSSMLARKLGVPVSEVKNVTIFGNHSATQFPYADRATANGESLTQQLADDAFLAGDFIKLVQQRGAEVINARGLSSAMSAANAVKDHIHDWFFGTKGSDVVSMAVNSTGNPYGIADGLVFSFPVSIENKKWTIKPGFAFNEAQAERLRATEKELLDERETVLQFSKI